MEPTDLKLGSIIKNPMELVLKLAELGRFSVSPNPMVGAIIIKNQKLVGYGYHLYHGDQHAEIKAISMAGENSIGAILYINLEPCSHYGQTPPCIDQVIKSGITEIHIATIDPNPLVNGKSIAKLKEAGIKIIIGEMAQAAEELNEIFFHYMRNKRPFVIAKWAMSIDGKMATANYDSKWITNEEARGKSHQFRNMVDAIIVGANTVIYDNPTLNVREINLAKIRNPIKIIIGKNLDSLPEGLNIFEENPDKTYLVCGEESALNFDNIIKIKQDKSGYFDLAELLDKLGALSITSVLIEGGGFTLGKFLEADLINKFYCFVAPKFITGKNSVTPFGIDIGINAVKAAKTARFNKCQFIGDDIFIEGEFK